jgi:hypothetical protein
MPLNKAELAELKELYSPEAEWRGLKEMAKYFGVNEGVIRYAVNYNGYREKQKIRANEWRKKNPEKWKKIGEKAMKKFYHKIRNDPIRYKKHLEYQRKRYLKKKTNGIDIKK